jgi:hypothetical protein
MTVYCKCGVLVQRDGQKGLVRRDGLCHTCYLRESGALRSPITHEAKAASDRKLLNEAAPGSIGFKTRKRP